MFDFKFDWKEELNTGIEAVDQQHQQMFRIVRDIEQLLIIHCIGVTDKQLYAIIRELREFVSYHFYEEEKLMMKYNVSSYEAHVKDHRRMVKLIEGINIPRLGKQPYEELLKIKDGIQDNIFSHMFHVDIDMCKEINEIMETRREKKIV